MRARCARKARPTCPVPTLLKSVPFLRVREGDQATVTITGHKKPPSPAPSTSPSAAPSKAPAVVWVVPPGVTSVNAGTGANQYTIRVPQGAAPNGFIISALPGSPTPTPSPSASPSNEPTLPPNGTIGGPADRLSADVKDPSVATIATAVPTTVPNARGEDTPSVAYTIKGQHAGGTRMMVSQGNDCVAVDLSVRPPTNRFTLTTGVGASLVSVNTFTSTTVTPQPSPAPGAPPQPPQFPAPGTYVYATETSKSQVSVPILGSFRVTDFPAQLNVFLTGGFFADSGRDKQVYGISIGSSDFLFTVGTHSAKVDSLSPYVNNGFLAAPGAPTTVSSRTMRPFYSLTFPLSTFADILGKIK